jgi:hypothetical protein
MFRYRLHALLILLAIGPLVLEGLLCLFPAIGDKLARAKFRFDQDSRDRANRANHERQRAGKDRADRKNSN